MQVGFDYSIRYKNMSEESKQRMKWNKGLTKETSQSLRKFSNTLHQKYQSGELISSWTGRTHTKQQVDKIVHGMIHKRKGKRGFRCGWYKGYWCDSSWQLAFVIYNLQHGIKFKRNEIGFEYTYNGKCHLYYPDFIMQDGTYIEIKGWVSDEALEKINQFPKELNIKMLIRKDMQLYLSYVKSQYGNDFIKLYQQD